MNLPLANRITRLHDVLRDLRKRGKRTSSYHYLARRFGVEPYLVLGLIRHVARLDRRGML